MEKAKFITIAAALGIAVPTCLLCTSEECNAKPNSQLPSVETLRKAIKDGSNPIKTKIISVFSDEEFTPSQQIAHTNVHANYTISHTNVHSDYCIDNRHSNSHSNTPQEHVDSHSNARI